MLISECAFTNGLAGKIKKKNFKIRRRSQSVNMGLNLNLNFGTVAILLTLVAMFDFVICESENDVLTLQDDLQLDVNDEATDRRRPANEQEKDILLLDALGRRKGSYSHNTYSSPQEDDSIMDLLGKSKYDCFLN